MKSKSNKVNLWKKSLVPLAGMVVFLPPLTIVACSNSSNLSLSQTWINQAYQSFENAIIKVENNTLYQEYFDTSKKDEDGWFIIPYEIVSKILNVTEIQNNPQINEVYYGKIENSTLKIKYKIFNGYQELSATFIQNEKVIGGIKQLSKAQSDKLNEVLTKWQSHTIEIKNENEKLETTKYKDIPTILLQGDRDDENNKFFSQTLKTFSDTNAKDQDFKLKFKLDFQDKKISLKLDFIFDQNLNIPVVLDANNLKKQTKTIEGFKDNKTYQKEVEEIYKPIGRYYDLSDLNNNKNYPQLASSIYNIEQLGILLNNLKTTVNNNDKFSLPEFFDKDKSKNLWYELKVSLNANDIIGTVNADFTIVDKFTKTEIRPQNVTKIMTLNKFHPLVANTENKQDYATMENVYQAYKLFEVINLKDDQKNQALASKDPNLNFDLNWLKTNTDFAKDQEFEVSFDISQIEKPEEKPTKDQANPNLVTNKFRILKINNQQVTTTKATANQEDKIKAEIINDDVIGVKKIPFVLQIQLDIEGAKANQWYTVLPHLKTQNGASNEEFSAKSAETKYIQVGGYCSEDLDTARKIYNEFSGDNAQLNTLATNNNSQIKFKTIEIGVNQTIFDELISKKQKEAVEALETQKLITQKIKQVLLDSIEPTIKDNVDLIINKFNFFLDLSETKTLQSETDSQTNKINKLKTDVIDLKLSAKNNNDHFFDNINDDGQKEAFPKLQVVIKLDKNTTLEQSLDQQINKAYKAVSDYMNLQSYVYADKLPSEFDMSNGQNSLTVWSPKQNYGYITQFYTNGHVNDDDKGTKTIKILLTRGKQKQTFDVTIKGFLTKTQKQVIKQNQANSDLDVKQYLNLQTQPSGGSNSKDFTFYRSLLRLKPGLSIKASEIPNYLTGEKIKEIADIETAKAGQMVPYFDNLLKKQLPTGVELKFSNIKQPINRGVLAPQISADVQLIKKDQNQIKESAVVKMSINGFEYDQNYLNTNLLSQVADVFSTFDSPIKRDMENPSDPVKNFYNTKKASEIKTLESLKTEFWDRVSVDSDYVLEYEHLVLPPVKIKLLELVNGSQNDRNGSLKVRIKLSWKDLDQLESIEREITLFGFKPDGSPHS